MSQQAEIAAQKRTILGKKVKRLRREGWIPGIMYGHGFDALPLQFDRIELRKLLSQVGGSQLIHITLSDGEEPLVALVRDVDRDVISGDLLHVDFYHVTMTERLTAEIPLVIQGESPIVTEREGIMLQGVSSLEVECLPGDLIDSIEIDVSTLVELDQGIYVRDLDLPESIDVLTDPEEMIARVVRLEERALLEEEEVEEDLFAEMPEVEVITEAKEEGEEEFETEGEEF
jgi:large subunit ribosomal protein L25